MVARLVLELEHTLPFEALSRDAREGGDAAGARAHDARSKRADRERLRRHEHLVAVGRAHLLREGFAVRLRGNHNTEGS